MEDPPEIEDAEMKEWDPQVAEQWKHEAVEKNTATRLQDLSLGMNSSHEAVSEAAASLNETWPFEKSPCRWHGAKNTRGGAEAEAINKQLFKTDFKTSESMDVEEESKKKIKEEDELNEESDIESEESSLAEDEEVDDDDVTSTGSFCDDDDTDEDVAPAKSSSRNKKELKASTAAASVTTSDKSNRARRTTSQRDQRVSYCEDMDTEPERPVIQRNKSSSSSSSKRSELKEADYADSKYRETNYNSMLAWNKPATHEPSESSRRSRSSSHHSRRSSISGAGQRPSSSESSRDKDELSASCHGQVERERKPILKSSSSSARSPLSSVTCHGTVSQSRLGPSSTTASSSSRRVPPPRTKSSDGAELGAATLHGGTSVSRIRGGKRRPPGETSSSRSGSSRDSKGAAKPGERRMLKRAMSIRNVKRPEEYAAAHGAAPDAVEPNDTLAKTSSRRGTSHCQTTGDRSTSGLHARHQDPSTTARSSSSSSRAQETATMEAKPREGSSHASRTSAPPQRTSSSSSHSRQRRATVTPTPTEPRRDLLVLLRDQKKVTQDDLLDKENRRLLHFLMMEHKMGISGKELYHAIRADQAEMAA